MRIPHVIDFMRPQLHAESCNLHADCDYMRWPHVKLHADYLQCNWINVTCSPQRKMGGTGSQAIFPRKRSNALS